jgi:hypothetical protein
MFDGEGCAGVARGGDEGRGGCDGRGTDGRAAVGAGAAGPGGTEDRVFGTSPDDDGARGRKDSNGVGGRGRGVRTSGVARCVPEEGGPAAASGDEVRARLYSRQHAGHRHSTTSEPSGFL